MPRLPYFLLGAMTIVSFGGPFVILMVVRGGPRPEWPPDRVVEWVVIGMVFGLAFSLFTACVTIGWWYPGARKPVRGSWPGERAPSSGEARHT